MFIGFVFNVLLYGIMITQVYLYFTAYKQFVFSFSAGCGATNNAGVGRDKMWIKLFVCAPIHYDEGWDRLTPSAGYFSPCCRYRQHHFRCSLSLPLADYPFWCVVFVLHIVRV